MMMKTVMDHPFPYGILPLKPTLIGCHLWNWNILFSSMMLSAAIWKLRLMRQTEKTMGLDSLLGLLGKA